MKQVTSNDGTVISYRQSGSGPPLLLVHGTTADHTRWAAISPHLEKYFTVYAMDRRGRGGSGDASEYNIRREFEDVARIAEAIGGPVTVLGHSYGAICSLEAALLTNQIGRLILYEPPIPTGLPIYPPEIPEKMQVLIDQGEPEAALELFFREVVKMPEYELEAYRKLPVWKTRIKLATTIPREMVLDQSYRFKPENYTGLKVPTLLLLGGDSPRLFRQAIEVLHDALPHSRVAVMPEQQHIAMDINPMLFVSEVVRFMSK